MLSRSGRLGVCLAFAVVAAACSGGPGPQLGEGPSGDVDTPAVTATEPADLGSEVATVAPVGETILVGVILDNANVMLGFDRQPGVAFLGAVEAINANGGLLGTPIELEIVDSGSRMSTVDGASRRMIADGAQLLVVTCELDFAAPAVGRAEDAGVLVISPCASEDSWSTGEVGDLAFSMVGPASVYGADMADYVWADGARSAAVYWDETTPESRSECQGFSEQWAELGGQFTIDQPVNYGSVTSISASEDAIANLRADVVVVCAASQLGTTIFRNVRATGSVAPIVAGPTLDSVDFRPVAIEGLGDFRLLSFASPAGDDPEAAVRAATDRFEAVDGIPPGSGRFVLGADLANVWSAAVTQTGTTDGAAVAAALRGTEAFAGVSGNVGFDDGNAAVQRVLRVRRHVDGELVFLEVWPR